MRMGRFRASRRAASPVLATLLMIAIAVAASIIVYVWGIALIGGLMGSGGSQTKEQLIMEAYNWSGTTLDFTLRNVGSTTVTVASVYLGGLAILTSATSLVPIGAALPFTLTASGSYTAGAAYTLMVVSVTGGVFAFSVINGSSS